MVVEDSKLGRGRRPIQGLAAGKLMTRLQLDKQGGV